MSDADAKFRAKRRNEHIKSAYSFLNTLAAAVIVTGFIAPTITLGAERVSVDARGWIVIGLLLHGAGHFMVWLYMKREE